VKLAKRLAIGALFLLAFAVLWIAALAFLQWILLHIPFL